MGVGVSDVLMTVAEAAGYLRCHPQTVRSLIHSGRLPAVKLNRQYRIKLEDLQAGVRVSDRAIDLLRRSLDAAPRVGCVCPWDEVGNPIGEHSQMCGSFIGVFKEIQDFLRELDEADS